MCPLASECDSLAGDGYIWAPVLEWVEVTGGGQEVMSSYGGRKEGCMREGTNERAWYRLTLRA